MALRCARLLASRQIAGSLYRPAFLTQARCVTLKASPAGAGIPNEKHDERNERLNRPLSPHLLIYKPQLTSLMSISHRISGTALSGYFIALGIGSLVLPENIPHYLQQLEDLHMSGLMTAIKFALAIPLVYHYVNGIRHLLWDSAKFLTIPDIYKTGYITLALTLVLSIGIANL